MVILEYLEEMYPDKPLLPSDPVRKAKVREICEIIGSGIQPLQNIGVTLRIDSENPEKRFEWARFWIEKGFTALEKKLSTTSGKYCFGNELTLADCFLVPQVSNAFKYKVNVAQYPNISRIDDNLKKLEAVKQADAFVQPDCPAEPSASQLLE